MDDFENITDIDDIDRLENTSLIYPGFESERGDQPNFTTWPKVRFDDECIEQIVELAQGRANKYSVEDAVKKHRIGLMGELATAAYLSKFTYSDVEPDLEIYDDNGDMGYDLDFSFHYNIEVKTSRKLVDGDTLNRANINSNYDIEVPKKQINNADYVILAYPDTPYEIRLCGWVNQLQFWSRCEESKYGENAYEIDAKAFNPLPKKDVEPSEISAIF